MKPLQIFLASLFFVISSCFITKPVHSQTVIVQEAQLNNSAGTEQYEYRDGILVIVTYDDDGKIISIIPAE